MPKFLDNIEFYTEGYNTESLTINKETKSVVLDEEWNKETVNLEIPSKTITYPAEASAKKKITDISRDIKKEKDEAIYKIGALSEAGLNATNDLVQKGLNALNDKTQTGLNVLQDKIDELDPDKIREEIDALQQFDDNHDNIENGEGQFSLRQVGTTDAQKPKATGLGAVAFGGFRGDKPTGTPNALPTTIENENIDNPVDDTTSLAAGIQSAVFGAGNRAYGNWDFIAGKDNVTFGKSSFAFGNGNIVGDKTKNGEYSFAFAAGTDHKLLGKYASAFGEENTVESLRGTAFGHINTLYATAINSFASGYLNRVQGESSATFGNNNINDANHTLGGGANTIIGINTSGAIIYGSYLHTRTTTDPLGTSGGSSKIKALFGQYNDTLADDAIFAIGNGESETNRSNALELKSDSSLKLSMLSAKGQPGITDAQKPKATGLGAVAFGGIRTDKPYEDLSGSDKIPTEAAGDQSVAFGANNYAGGAWNLVSGKGSKTYQRSSVAMGGACQSGMSKDEFNEYWSVEASNGYKIPKYIYENNQLYPIERISGENSNGLLVYYTNYPGYISLPSYGKDAIPGARYYKMEGDKLKYLTSDWSYYKDVIYYEDSGRPYETSSSFAFTVNSDNIAFGKNSAGFGSYNKIYGKGSAAFGQNNRIEKSCYNAFVAGQDNTLTGESSFVFGNNIQNNGSRVFSSGANNIIRDFAKNAIVSGDGLITDTTNSVTHGSQSIKALFGQYNYALAGDELFVIGNGEPTRRSNAFEVLKNGTTKIFGNLHVGGGQDTGFVYASYFGNESGAGWRCSTSGETRKSGIYPNQKLDYITLDADRVTSTAKPTQNDDVLRWQEKEELIEELTVNPATASTYGSVKLGSDEIQTATGGVYPVQKNQDGQLCVRMLYSRNWYNILLCAIMKEQAENATKEFSSVSDDSTYTFSGDDKWHCVQGNGYLTVGNKTINLTGSPGGFVIYYGSFHQYDVYYCVTRNGDESFGSISATTAPTITSTIKLRYR